MTRCRACILLPFLMLRAATTQAWQDQAPSIPQRPPAPLAQPVAEGPFLVPAPGSASEPYWGIRGGIGVGLWPTPGPRGLFRIYAPYLDQPRLRVLQFVAVEPIVAGRRGYSELERSQLDGRDGKVFWSLESRENKPAPQPPWQPARGRIEPIEGTDAQSLTVVVAMERFANGARPLVQFTLRSDRPHEIAFRVDAAADSAPMSACVITATMGNYARLRHLWLNHEVVASGQLWNGMEPDVNGFLPPRQWRLDHLLVHDGEAVVAATSDERDPASAANQPRGWRYVGRPATQLWHARAEPGLVARVNGRQTYWASNSPIPGGTSYENFELEAPFRPGQDFRLTITPQPPAALGFKPSLAPPTPPAP